MTNKVLKCNRLTEKQTLEAEYNKPTQCIKHIKLTDQGNFKMANNCSLKPRDKELRIKLGISVKKKKKNPRSETYHYARK